MASKRLNTGVIRNGDDWPGIFIRGDETRNMVLDMQIAIRVLRGQESTVFEPGTDMAEAIARHFEEHIEFLDSCGVDHMTRGAGRDDIQVVEYK